MDVDIVNETSSEVLDRCSGPTNAGTCPRADEHGVVACAGLRIAPKDGDSTHWLMMVPSRSRHCPLAWDFAYVGL